MSCDFVTFACAGVKGLHPYQPGKPIEELQRELGLQRVVKLASNENPLGLSAMAQVAIEQALAESARYPDGSGHELKRALAAHHSVDVDQITLGNGSNDLLDLIGRVFLTEQSSAVYSQHAFIVYPITVQALGARAIVTPAKDWGHDLKAMSAAIEEDTRLVFIANPNNPTGTCLSQEAIAGFMEQVPEQVIVVLDEAYFEYADGEGASDGLLLLKRFSNLIVSRTFSKAYGLAGLRVGYSISDPVIAELINRVRAPFNVNSLALAAAAAVLEDQAYLSKSCQVNRDGMAQLVAGLNKLGLSYIPSKGNFMTVDVGQDALSVYQALLKKGVIVRPIGVYEMPRHLRFSVGLEAENTLLLTSLEQVLS